MNKHIKAIAIAGTAALTGMVGFASASLAEYPEKPITVIVPFGAGGGSDTLMRTIQKVIEDEDLLPVPLIVLNVGGAGSSIGSRRVAEADPDGHTFLLSHFALLGIAATGVADFGPDAFKPVIQVSEACLLYTVRDDAKWQTLDELFTEAQANPGTIKEAINIGAVVHVTSWMLTDAFGGIEMRYVQTGGGAKRFPALVGGLVDAAQFSTSEYVSFSPKGIRALAYAGPSRHPRLPDIPTTREQGIDTTACINDWFLAPAGTPDDRVAFFADAIAKAVQSPAMDDFYHDRMTERVILTGAELEQKIASDFALVSTVADRHTDELRILREEQAKKK